MKIHDLVADALRQMAKPYGPVLGKENGALDNVAKLADVAGIIVGQQRVQGLALNREAGFVVVLRVESHEMLGQHVVIVAVFAQTWKRDGRDVDPIVEILPKFADGRGVLQILGRGENGPHVHLDGRVPANAGDGVVLQNARQFSPHVQGHVAGLVEQQRPAVRDFKLALAGFVGAGEGPLFTPRVEAPWRDSTDAPSRAAFMIDNAAVSASRQEKARHSATGETHAG